MYFIRVVAVLNGKELPFGIAYDNPTLLSLLELAKMKGATKVVLTDFDGVKVPRNGIDVALAQDMAMNNSFPFEPLTEFIK